MYWLDWKCCHWIGAFQSPAVAARMSENEMRCWLSAEIGSTGQDRDLNKASIRKQSRKKSLIQHLEAVSIGIDGRFYLLFWLTFDVTCYRPPVDMGTGMHPTDFTFQNDWLPFRLSPVKTLGEIRENAEDSINQVGIGDLY